MYRPNASVKAWDPERSREKYRGSKPSNRRTVNVIATALKPAFGTLNMSNHASF